jgi:hypothetical protein
MTFDRCIIAFITEIQSVFPFPVPRVPFVVARIGAKKQNLLALQHEGVGCCTAVILCVPLSEPWVSAGT